MWNHDCKVERTRMSVEDGKECNWCGRREEDEGAEFGKLGPNEFPDDEVEDFINGTSEVTIDEFIEHEDGSATIKMEIAPELQQAIFKGGLEYLIREMKMQDKVKVLAPNEFSGEAKKWEITDEEYNALFHFGFIDAIKRGMNEIADSE